MSFQATHLSYTKKDLHSFASESAPTANSDGFHQSYRLHELLRQSDDHKMVNYVALRPFQYIYIAFPKRV